MQHTVAVTPDQERPLPTNSKLQVTPEGAPVPAETNRRQSQLDTDYGLMRKSRESQGGEVLEVTHDGGSHTGGRLSELPPELTSAQHILDENLMRKTTIT